MQTFILKIGLVIDKTTQKVQSLTPYTNFTYNINATDWNQAVEIYGRKIKNKLPTNFSHKIIVTDTNGVRYDDDRVIF